MSNRCPTVPPSSFEMLVVPNESQGWVQHANLDLELPPTKYVYSPNDRNLGTLVNILRIIRVYQVNLLERFVWTAMIIQPHLERLVPHTTCPRRAWMMGQHLQLNFTSYLRSWAQSKPLLRSKQDCTNFYERKVEWWITNRKHDNKCKFSACSAFLNRKKNICCSFYQYPIKHIYVA